MVLKFSDTVIRSNTILYCSWFEKTVLFYRDILKLSVHHQTTWLVEFLLFDNTFLSVADAKRTSIRSSNGDGVTISLKVKELELAHEYLSKKVSDVSEIKEIWGSMAFYLYDPDGHRIEIWEQ